MSDLTRWLPDPPDLGAFRFRPPLSETVRFVEVPGDDEPIWTAESRTPDGRRIVKSYPGVDVGRV